MSTEGSTFELGRIAVISPVLATDSIDVQATLRPFRDLSLRVENFFIDEGPPAIETEADITACLPGLLATAARLARQDWQAFVINCMCDPGVAELRAAHAIPIFGPAETSMRAIASSGARFAVLDVVAEGRELVERQVECYGVRAQYVSHHAIEIPVLELFVTPERTLAALEKAARAALKEGAETMLLGCTGLAEFARSLRARLNEGKFSPAVVEPLGTTIAVTHALLGVGGLRTRAT